jgi:ABC-type multidrug transport system fused ATPase/permease subunit
VNLAEKLDVPDSGAILVNGHDLRSVTSESLHRQIASVTQDNFLFSGSVIENIRLLVPTLPTRRCTRPRPRSGSRI